MHTPHSEREMHMNHWQPLLLMLAGLLLLCAVFSSALAKHRERRQRDFTRELETLLQPKETVKAICPQKGGHCILTGSRILFEKNGSFAAFPLKKIKKLQGKNEKGNRTTVPKNMVSLTVMLEKEYILKNTGAEFEEFAAVLQKSFQKQHKKESQKK